MPDLFTQLSRWEWVGLALTIIILNSLFLKWFLAWSQSDASDEVPSDGSLETQPSSRGATPALAGASLSSSSSSGRGPVAPGRPRRRKHLQESGGGGGSSSIGSAGKSSSETDSDGAADSAEVEKPKVELEPVAASTGSSVLAPTSGVTIPGRSFAEVKSTPEPLVESHPPTPSPEPAARPSRRAPIPAISLPLVEAPATAAAKSDEQPATAAAQPRERFSASVAGAMLTRDELRSSASSTSAPVHAEAAAPAVAEIVPHLDEPKPGTQSPVVEHEPVSAAAAEEKLSLVAEIPAESIGAGSEISTPAITSSLSLHTEPLPVEVVAATPLIEVAPIASEHHTPVEVAAEGSPPAADLILPEMPAGASPALAAITSEHQDVVVASTEPTKDMTSEPPSETPAKTMLPTSAQFAPATKLVPSPESRESGAVTPAGGRPVIARRSVGPARAFLTREFSSLRIKSDLNPPKSPALAAARAENLSAKITPSIPPISSDKAETPTPESAAAAPKPGSDLVAATGTTIAPTETEPVATRPDAEEALAAEYQPIAETPAPAEPTVEPTAENVAEDEPLPEPEPEPVASTSPAATDVEAAHHPAVEEEEEEEESHSPVVSPTAHEEIVAEPPVAESDEAPASVADSEPESHEPVLHEPEPVEHAPIEHDAPESVPVPAMTSLVEEPAATPQASLVDVPPIAPGPESSVEEESAPEAPAPIDIAPVPAMLTPVSAEAPAPQFITTPTPAPTYVTTRHFTPTMTNAPTTNGERATAQLTFSFEVASLQLTPFFKLGSVQLRPLSNVVSMQLAHGDSNAQGAVNPLSANIAFEILTATTGGGNHGPVHALVLKPLSEARAAATPQPKLAVNAVQLTHGSETGPIQITPAHTSATSVQVLATFAIAGIDFTPHFEIGSMRLEPTSSQVLLKLSPGSGQGSSLEHLPPSFELTDVQVTPEGQISAFTLVPRAS